MNFEDDPMSESERTEAEPGIGAAGAAYRTVLLLVIVLATIPTWITQMGHGLDPSWSTGLHIAAARGMVHGRDVVFTYGPLGFALIPKEYGEVAPQAVAIRLGLMAAWWATLGILLSRVRGVVAPLAFAATAAYCGVPIDQEFNLALAGVTIFPVAGLLLLADLDRRRAWAVPAAFLAGAAMLTKFNVGVACTGALGLWSLLQLARDRSRRTWIVLGLLGLVYFGSMGFLFRSCGGPLRGLYPFLRASMDLASGYSSQMTIDKPAETSVAATATMVVLTAIGLAVAAYRRSALTTAFAVMLVPMFVMYKGAVVRQSSGHFLASWTVMVSLTALLIPAAGRAVRVRAVATAAALLALAFGIRFAPLTPHTLLTRGPANWLALVDFDTTRAQMREYDGALKRGMPLPPAMRERIGDQTVDVFPWEIAYVWTNDLNWRPRPVFQSYTAYTPRLDRMGADLYNSEAAPRFILYMHQAIDTEHPCQVDSQTWIEILRWYDCVDRAGDLLLLERRASPRWLETVDVDSKVVAFDTPIQPPPANQAHHFLKAELELTLLGRIWSILYRVEPPVMRVDYVGGGEPSYHRMVWRTAAGGFLFSSLPRDAEAVALLLQGTTKDRVASIAFLDPPGYFKPRARVTTSMTGATPPPPAASAAAH